jgi:release factor glutamine methyltransferase
VEFLRGDALGNFDRLFDEKFDVVVSNPPYIPHSDITLMRRNVVDYEPHMALFVSDDDPLIFYRSIARTSRRMLRCGGGLYFEIYESLVAEMCDMLRSEGYADIAVREDFRGKPRMICARIE